MIHLSIAKGSHLVNPSTPPRPKAGTYSGLTLSGAPYPAFEGGVGDVELSRFRNRRRGPPNRQGIFISIVIWDKANDLEIPYGNRRPAHF